MKIVMADHLVRTESFEYHPYCRYVVSEFEFDQLTTQTSRTDWRFSAFASYERRYGGQDLNGKKLCVYRHSAVGDQLMISCLPYYLKSRYPKAKIHLYCHPSMRDLWLGDNSVDGCAMSLPIPFDILHEYDYHLFFEGMLEGNSEPDQNCCYDDMYAFAGIRPNTVSEMFKVPHVEARPEDWVVFHKALAVPPQYLLYHLSPANANRMYPIKLGLEFIRLFLSRHPEYNVVLVGQRSLASGTTIPLDEILKTFASRAPKEEARIVNLVDKFSTPRQLLPLIQEAKVVVCPDSMVLHAAAMYPWVPMISLWGLFHPHDRAAYYKNDHPLFHPEACRFAPCRNHEFSLPKDKCEEGAGHPETGYCHALEAITPEQILTEVEAHL